MAISSPSASRVADADDDEAAIGEGTELLAPAIASALGEGALDVDFGVRANTLGEVAAAQAADQEWLSRRGIGAFVDVVSATSFRRGVRHFMQLSGLGKLKPNIVVLGFKNDWRSVAGKPAASDSVTAAYYNVVRDLISNDYSLMVVRSPELITRATQMMTGRLSGTIDVWWLVADGGVTALLPFLLSKHRLWQQTRLRIFSLAGGVAPEVRRERLMKTLAQARIVAEVIIVEGDFRMHDEEELTNPDEMSATQAEYAAMGQPVNAEALLYIRLADEIRSKSSNSTLCFINLPVPHGDATPKQYMAWLDILTAMSLTTVLIRGNNKEVLSVDL